MMISAWSLLLAVLAGFGVQGMALPTTQKQQIEVSVKMKPERADPGEHVVLTIDIRPKDKMRVYAPASKEYTGVAMLITPQKGIKFGRPTYPEPKHMKAPGRTGREWLYEDEFTLKQELELDEHIKREQQIVVLGMLVYQACDDKKVYPPSRIPVKWTLTINPERRDRPTATGADDHP